MGNTYLFDNEFSILLADDSFPEEFVEKSVGVVPSDVHQSQEQLQPVGTLRVNRHISELALVPDT